MYHSSMVLEYPRYTVFDLNLAGHVHCTHVCTSNWYEYYNCSTAVPRYLLLFLVVLYYTSGWGPDLFETSTLF
jgi:hypothetical protein